MIRPYPVGFSSRTLSIEHAAAVFVWCSINFFSVSTRINGTSPESKSTSESEFSSSFRADSTASPVPRCFSWTTKLASSPTSASTACSTSSAWWPTIVMIERGSSACAALTTCAINGAPPSSCSTFARFDFILVPRPAAMIKTFSGLDDVFLLDISRKILDDDRGECLFAAVEHDMGQTIGIVPDLLAIVQQISADDLGRLIECVVNGIVNTDLISALGSVAFGLLGADASIVNNDVIEMDLRRVLLDRFQMFAGTVAVSFTGLSHQVVDEDLCRARLADHPRDLAHEQVRQDARVERA